MSNSFSNNRKLGCLILLFALIAIVTIAWSRVAPTSRVSPILAQKEVSDRKARSAGDAAGRARAQQLSTYPRGNPDPLKEASAAADKAGYKGDERLLFIQGFVGGFRSERK
jgi:hypothetical protein